MENPFCRNRHRSCFDVALEYGILVIVGAFGSVFLITTFGGFHDNDVWPGVNLLEGGIEI